MSEPITVEIVSGPTSWRERRLAELRADLESAGVDATLDRPVGTPAPGEKGTVQSVALLLAASPIVVSVMATVRTVVGTWLVRDSRTTVRLTRGEAHLEITGELDEGQQRALERFLDTTGEQDDGSW